jgi:tetratricopeptide (TPR) repeat protein/tRNA A-37 threonylcarbamoyl transferase component Bud32
MSRVFVAYEQTLGRRVVIKILPPELGAGVSAERFRREIQLAAQLQHPHIVPVLTAGEMDGLPFYTMPMVEGETLRAKLARGGELPVAEAIRLLRDVAKVLAYAHRNGVVHRDIKPENILLSDDSALVSDFGVAKALSHATSVGEGLTSLGVALGTPAYMAPEQASADPTVDHRADLYAFGAVAYEMLAGRSPFHGRTPQQMLAAHLTEKPQPVELFRPATPPPLASLIARCLEKHPADRPQSAVEVLNELDALATPSAGTMAATSPTFAIGAPATPATKATPATTRRALLLYLAAFVVVAGLARLAVLALDVPSWVFPGAVVVMLLGLPMVLMTVRASRVGEHAGGLFTWRRTLQGGIAATAMFSVLVAGWVVLRSLGIGPAGSLAAAGVIGERESVLVADFGAPARDSSLGTVVAEAFRTDLSQSRSFSVVAASTVRAVLARMERNDAPRLDLALAREIAEREGIKVVVDGSVASVGESYVLTARLVTSDSGRVLAAFRETARDERELIPAINRLTKKVRTKAGESLRAVRETPTLEQVTTRSLEALRKYAQATRAVEYDGDFERGRALLEEAIALDSGFAMAWRKLGVVLGNFSMMSSAREEALAKAYEHRDRLTEVERYLTIASYLSARDRPRSMAAYQSVLSIDPDNYIAHNNLAIQYMRLHDYQRAVGHLRRSREISPRPNAYTNLAEALVGLDSVTAARRLIDTAIALFPGNIPVLFAAWQLRATTADYDSAAAIAATYNDKVAANSMSRTLLASMRGIDARARGQLVRSIREFEASWEFEARVGNRSAPLRRALEEPWVDIWFRDAPERAKARMDRALAQHPLDSIPAPDRPYTTMASMYAETGAVDKARALLDEMQRALTADQLQNPAPARREVAARIAIAEGRPLDAVAQFAANTQEGCAVCSLPDLARAYDLANKPDSAIAVYERYLTTRQLDRYWTDADYLAGSFKRLGELYEQRGERRKALSAYLHFVELWREADPELQPLVSEVRRRIERLRAVE